MALGVVAAALLARQGQGGELAAGAGRTDYLVMRLFWPKAEPPSNLPPGEGTSSPPALTQAG